MKLDTITLTLRNSDDERVYVTIDLFYREFSIQIPNGPSALGKAIGASALIEAVYEASPTAEEADVLMQTIYGMMDAEGKTIMRQGIRNFLFKD